MARGPERPGRGLSHDYRFGLMAAALLAAEAVAILLTTSDHILGVDGIYYARYAKNLVDHGAFSLSASPPWEPSAYRTPGYPLFLAALRLIGGNSVLIVRVA